MFLKAWMFCQKKNMQNMFHSGRPRKLCIITQHPICSKRYCFQVPCLAFTGFPRYLENLAFCHLLFQIWNLLKKCENTGILIPNLGKKHAICKFCVSRFTFQYVLYKKSDLHLGHIYIINTNTDSKPNWPGISLLLPGKYMEFCVTRASM